MGASLHLRGQCSQCGDDPRDFSAKGQTVDAYIEIDVGQGRCGVIPGEACAVLAEKIVSYNSLTLKGIQAYSGWNQHIQTLPDRADATEKGPISGVKASIDAIKSKGIDTTGLVITGGGTGTYTLEGSNEIYTEIQPGSYSVMDGEYGQTSPCDGTHYDNALFVLTTVMSDSSAHPDWVVVDAGDKAVHPGNAGITVLTPGYDPTTGIYNPPYYRYTPVDYLIDEEGTNMASLKGHRRSSSICPLERSYY